jgi:hypothetical protein
MPHIAVRVLIGAGLFIFGYYLGREVSRGEFIRKGLDTLEHEADK